MAQPQKYQREHDFTLDEPSDVSTSSLNREFDDIAVTTDGLRENLAKIQNDDGSLKRGIVKKDSLGSDVLSEMEGVVTDAQRIATEAADRAAKTSAEFDANASARITEVNSAGEKWVDAVASEGLSQKKLIRLKAETLTPLKDAVDRLGSEETTAALNRLNAEATPDNIDTLAGHAAEIDAVAGNISSVVTSAEVFGDASTVEAVKNVSDNISDVVSAIDTTNQNVEVCKGIKEDIFQYSWDIPHLVKTLDDVKAYPYDGLFAVAGFGNPGRHGEDISSRVVTVNGEAQTLGFAFANAYSIKPTIRYVSPSGTGTGISAEDAMSIASAVSLAESFKNRLCLMLDDGEYRSDQITFDGSDVEIVGNVSDQSAVVLDFSSGSGYGIYAKNSNLKISGMTIRSAVLDGMRCDGGSVTAYRVSASSCGHSGFSTAVNVKFLLTDCTAESNRWNGFSFAQGCFGNVARCTSSGNSLHGFIANYTGCVYASDCVVKDSGGSGFFISGCSSVYIDRSSVTGSTVASVLASGLCRVSCQLSNFTGGQRGIHAEYGADVTLCDCNIDGGSVGASSPWGGLVAQYGGRVSYAYGGSVCSISNWKTGCYALAGGRIDLVRPTLSYLTFTNCATVSSPAFDSYGNNGGIVSGGEASGTNTIETAMARGQLGDANAVGSVDLNTLVTSGTYHCNGSATNKPSGFGQCVVNVYKRATSDSTRKIVQVVFDLGSVSMAFRYGSCPNGDDSTVNWAGYQKVTTSAA